MVPVLQIKKDVRSLALGGELKCSKGFQEIEKAQNSVYEQCPQRIN